MPNHTVRISKEAQAEINRMAKLSGQSAKEYLDEVMSMGKYPNKWSEWAKQYSISESQVDAVLKST